MFQTGDTIRAVRAVGIDCDGRKRILNAGVPVLVVSVRNIGSDSLEVEILTVEQDVQPFLAPNLDGILWGTRESFERNFQVGERA